MMYRLLSTILRLLARAYLRRYSPTIIAITGNVGKTTTKEAVAAVVGSKYTLRATGGNLNNELGIPLTILGDFSERYYRTGGTWRFWMHVLWRGIMGLFSNASYPEMLVLEFGADRPGDIEKLTATYPPHIAVITHVGDVPVHVEFFASPRELAREKAHIIEHLESTDTAILGFDDLTVLEMRVRTKGRVRTFGLGDGADVRVTSLRPRLDGVRPLGIAFDVEVERHSMPVTISGALGAGLARASAAAVAVGMSLDIGLAAAVEALARMSVPAGRMRIIEGIRTTAIIDDTYNASPAATHSAIDTVRGLPATRHVLVLGDMRELGAYSVQAHQAIGTLAAEVADVLVCVGELGAVMADAAANQMPTEHIHRARDAHEASAMIQQLLRAGDLVLVKGSQGMRMEFIVQEIMARPEQATKMLVRQSELWLKK
jgi:UDP-N-acetylmuramyl pentapeptide synthase